jgi:branched-chain amino acid transport system ATP-binding protein
VSNLLQMDGVHSGYASVPVLRDIDLRVEAGEVVALLGANGAGKTTTLLTVSGVLEATKGSLSVLGGPIRKNRPWLIARRGVAHVPEDRALFFSLTVRENLLLGRRRGRADIERVVEYFPALGPLLPRCAGLLSGGEQQMLALGRAFVSGPKLLLVDEMSLGLAPVIVERLMPVLRTIADSTGAGVLFVEQHIDIALEVADRAYVLGRGRVMLEGSASELKESVGMVEASYLGEDAIESVR